MVLAANEKGFEEATSQEVVTWLAFPFSISPTFLKLNIHADLLQGFKLVDQALNLCLQKGKKLKVYITMAFGNPYHDDYHFDMVYELIVRLYSMGVKYITLSDITGVATPNLISRIYSKIILNYPNVEFGLHLHTTPQTYYVKVNAAVDAGCRSFDAVINGMGGCPMTGYEMVSNLNTFELLYYCDKNKIDTKINNKALPEVIKKNKEVFKTIT